MSNKALTIISIAAQVGGALIAGIVESIKSSRETKETTEQIVNEYMKMHLSQQEDKK